MPEAVALVMALVMALVETLVVALASGCNTVVEHLPYHIKVSGLCCRQSDNNKLIEIEIKCC